MQGPLCGEYGPFPGITYSACYRDLYIFCGYVFA